MCFEMSRDSERENDGSSSSDGDPLETEVDRRLDEMLNDPGTKAKLLQKMGLESDSRNGGVDSE